MESRPFDYTISLSPVSYLNPQIYAASGSSTDVLLNMLISGQGDGPFIYFMVTIGIASQLTFQYYAQSVA